jgi:hypothetical protein
MPAPAAKAAMGGISLSFTGKPIAPWLEHCSARNENRTADRFREDAFQPLKEPDSVPKYFVVKSQ